MEPSFEKAKYIASLLQEAGANQCLLVGGWVRDHLLGIESKDLDIEVYGISYGTMVDTLRTKGYSLNLVGKSFGIIKVDQDIDLAIPRRENKCGIGHKAFSIMMDPEMTLQEAVRRRDFTINSIAMDFQGNIFDPLGGCIDLKKKVLRACSSAFSEDPLRVLRGMQFAARFGCTMDSKTLSRCNEVRNEYPAIAKERVFDEWRKWALKGKYPKMGLDILVDTGWVSLYPMLLAMNNTPQEPTWHPEGNVFVHTGYVCNSAAIIAERENLAEKERLILLFAALIHDIGKPSTTTRNPENRWVSPRHAEVGLRLSARFLRELHSPEYLISYVNPLVKEHMVHVGHDGRPSDKAIRRLANRLAPSTIRLWSMVCEADASGRPPLPPSNPVKEWISVAHEIAVSNQKPKPILMGRHLLKMGIEPGRKMGEILQKAFEQQLDGEFNTLADALEWVREKMPSVQSPE